MASHLAPPTSSGCQDLGAPHGGHQTRFCKNHQREAHPVPSWTSALSSEHLPGLELSLLFLLGTAN